MPNEKYKKFLEMLKRLEISHNGDKQKLGKFLEMLERMKVGCNGGNPKADLWFCGLENGGYQSKKYRDEENEKRLTKPGWKPDLTKSWNGLFGIFYDIIFGLGRIKKKGDPADMFRDGAPYYFANLFPFAFPSRHPKAEADKEIKKLTGINTLCEYKRACDGWRSESEEWHKFYTSAKVIVCFGKGHREDFIWQFSKSDEKSDEEYKKLKKKLDPGENILPLKLDDGKVLILCVHPASRKPKLDVGELRKCIENHGIHRQASGRY